VGNAGSSPNISKLLSLKAELFPFLWQCRTEDRKKNEGDPLKCRVWKLTISLLTGSPNVSGKLCFQKTLVLVFQHGRIQAEHVGVNGVY
jgi:hypothetical protein